jgi:2-polyprenyl-3-methyl-5-hydroxy-6-metoxy-1,4-benzoquinol methylase
MITCPLCKDATEKPIIMTRSPVFACVGVLNSEPETINETAILELRQCCACGFIFNAAFDPNKVRRGYRDRDYVLKKTISSAMSRGLQGIREAILSRLPFDATLVEIGSGDGQMIRSLAPHAAKVYTIDPSMESFGAGSMGNITHVNEFFRTSLLPKKPDFIIFRHLLEHISDPAEFLDAVIGSLANDGVIYVEVPNMVEIVTSRRFYDIFHDHFSYFQRNVLINALMVRGMETTDELDLFGGQHMGLFLRKSPVFSRVLPFTLYDSNLQKTMNAEAAKLDTAMSQARNAAIYGAGAHGNSVLNWLTTENIIKISYCFDCDEKKHGRYLQGSRIKIIPPSAAALEVVDTILLASSLYEAEIAADLRRAGFPGRLISTVKGLTW